MTEPVIGISLVYSIRLGSKSSQRLVTAIPLGPFSAIGPVCQLVVIIVIVLVAVARGCLRLDDFSPRVACSESSGTMKAIADRQCLFQLSTCLCPLYLMTMRMFHLQ